LIKENFEILGTLNFKESLNFEIFEVLKITRWQEGDLKF